MSARLIVLLLIISLPLGAYVPRRIATSSGLAYNKWADSTFPILWRMNSTPGSNISGSRSVVDVARLAFQAWSGVSGARVTFSEGSATPTTNAANDNVNLVSLVATDYTSGAAALTVLYTYTETGTDTFGRKIEFPGQILEADIIINPTALFSTDDVPAADRLDLQSQITHEIGHLLGLDHSALVSAVMFPAIAPGTRSARVLNTDDIIGLATLYPSLSFASKGTVRGLVRTPAGAGVFGAHVTLVDSSGRPIAGMLTDTDGSYQVTGLDPGNYSAYAEPLDGPVGTAEIPSMSAAFPAVTVSSQFTTRFAALSAATVTLNLTKTGGDSQTGSNGQALATPLEVQVTTGTGSTVAGATVRFAATSGGATVVPITAISDSQGKARTTAYLGTGQTQTFTAFVDTATVNFTATLSSTSAGATTAPVLTILPVTVPNATAGAAYSFTFTAAGGTPPYTWDSAILSSDAVDLGRNGMTMSTTGAFSGTPTLTGSVPLLIKVTDAQGRTEYVQYDFRVNGTGISRTITNSPPGGTQGTSYNFRFTTSWSGQFCAPTINFLQGSTPAGLSLNTLTGDFSGTPQVAGTFNFTLSANDNSACLPSPNVTNAHTFTLVIAAAGSPSSPPGASNWTRQGSQPVLGPSQSGWDSYALQSPSVLKTGNTFVMYYEGEDAATHVKQIGRATSSDGINWSKSANPVLMPGPAGSWDSIGVRLPSVHFDGTTYRMWYWGLGAGCNRIGLATSSDGISWTKHSGNPLALGGCDIDTYAPGTVLPTTGGFTMWYWSPLGGVGVATSNDGITWTNNGWAVFSNGSSTSPTVFHPTVIQDGSTYRMLFSRIYRTGRPTFRNGNFVDVHKANLGYATSTDGRNWSFYTDAGGFPNSIFVLGSEGAWDRPGVGNAFLMKDGTTFKMWYTGGRLNLTGTVQSNGSAPGYVEGSIGYAIIPGTNTAPTISSIANQTNVAKGATVGPLSFTINDAETSAGLLTVAATSSNPSFVANSAILMGGTGQNRTITVGPVANAEGSSTITITVTDPEGLSVSSSFTVTVFANAAAPAAEGDFNGDGQSDILFQDNQGFLAVWFMNGTNFQSASFLVPSNVGDTNYRIAGTGDFDNDGKEDILFQHTDGTLAVYLMNGSTQKSATLLNPSNPGASAWRAVGTGDINRDGKIDIVFQHTDGTLAVWLMNGTNLASSVFTSPSTPGDAGWKVGAVGDLNGDGHQDLIFQRTDGTLSAWMMNGTTLSQSAFMTPSQTALRVAGAADRNGDGKADLLLQAENTDLYFWLMNGSTQSSVVQANPPSSGASWRALGPR